MIDRVSESEVLLDIKRHFVDVTAFLNHPEAGVGVFKWCIKTNIIQVTDAYLEMIGAKETEVQNGLVGLIHPSHRSRGAREIRQALLGNRERFESLYRVQSNCRILRIFLFKGRIVRTDSRPVGIYGMAIDVTRILSLILELGNS